MNSVLEIKNLNKKYDTFSLSDVSFSVPAGYIMGFIGPNGAGKTTTIKSVLNMISPDGGEVTLFGGKEAIDSPELKDSIGVVMDLPFYVEDWKVKDVEMAVSPFYHHWDRSVFDSYLKRFDIAKTKRVKELSRGMKVKLMLAVALSHGAKLLVLDEPTSGLDPVARDELMDILGEFMKDDRNGVLFSTHITSDLEKIADYITFIAGGKIVYTGEKDRLLESFVRVTGGANDLTAEQKKRVIGYREHSVGFEGMIATENLRTLPKGIISEKINLDEIIIYMNKGAKEHE